MSDHEVPPDVRRAFEDSDAFEPDDDGFALTTTVLDSTVVADRPADGAGFSFHVTVEVPTLGAAVTSETVAAVVEDDWFETLERRLADVYSVASADGAGEPVVERGDDVVRVRLAFTVDDAGRGVADAKALIEYVEGTYAQGLIPGYEYRGPAGTLLERARNAGQSAAEGGSGPSS